MKIMILKVFAIASMLIMAGCDRKHSCEERGGKLVFSHFIFIYQPALKMNQLYPQYKCKFPWDA